MTQSNKLSILEDLLTQLQWQVFSSAFNQLSTRSGEQAKKIERIKQEIIELFKQQEKPSAD